MSKILFSKILFVCRANVCRSPMAEAIFNTLAEDAGLGIRAESAGIAALEGAGMDRKARAALDEIGVYAGDHEARQLTGPLLDEASLVLTMSPRQRDWILESLDVLPAKVHALPAYSGKTSETAGIADPHGQNMQSYRAASRVIADHAASLVERAACGELQAN